VDDEDEIRGRIASKINEEIGFKILGSAGNGYDALDLIEENDVDVVLTDIKMPFIDGIELTRIIRRDYPMIKVAFITGYDEFNYAKEAVALKVNRYMMKPVTSAEINSFLVQLKEDLDEEYKQMKDMLIIREKYEALLPVIGDSYLGSLIYSEKITNTDIEKLKLYGIHVGEHDHFITCLARIEESAKNDLRTIEQQKINTNEIFKKVFGKALFRHSLLIADGIVFVFSFDHYEKQRIDELLNELGHSTIEYLDSTLTIGVSKPFNSFKLLPKSFVEAKRAVGYSNNYGFGNVVFAEELYDNKIKQSFIETSDYSSINQVIQFGDNKDVLDLIESLKIRAMDENNFFIKDYVVIDLSSLIINLSEQAKISIDELLEQNIITKLNSYTSFDSMLDFVSDLLLKIKEQDNRERLSHSEKLINQIINYIIENHQNPELTLEKLSSIFNVSISHLSMLFKKHNGVTFSKYLINFRINKAKGLLNSTNMKIADISTTVGYKDVYYFSHSFKKVTGKSPRGYRNEEVV
jgi:two-component system response regulator YesN